MAVPTTGSLSLLGIFSEKNEDDYTLDNDDGEDSFSLRGLSSNSHNDSTGGNIDLNLETALVPDQIAPHRMSEFYGYNNDVFVPNISLAAGGAGLNIEVYTTFTSNPPSGVTLASASSTGDVRITLNSYGISTNGENIKFTGFVWSDSTLYPTITNNIGMTSALSSSNFDHTTDGFTYGETYYFRAWAQLTGGGIGYSDYQGLYMTKRGEVNTFISSANLTNTTAKLVFNMSDNGTLDGSANSYQAEKGWFVCVDTAPNANNPSVSNSTNTLLIVPNGVDQSNTHWFADNRTYRDNSPPNSPTQFSKIITGLSPGTLYYARAFVKMDKRPNSILDPGLASTAGGYSAPIGYGHGNVVSFTTTGTSVVGLPITNGTFSKPAFACYQATTATAYFPDMSPAVNDVVYSNSGATTFLSAGNYGVNIVSTQSNRRMTIGANGVITAFSLSLIHI